MAGRNSDEVVGVSLAQSCVGFGHFVQHLLDAEVVWVRPAQTCAGAGHHVEHHPEQVVSGTLVQDQTGAGSDQS